MENPSNGISHTAEKVQCSSSKTCLITDQSQANTQHFSKSVWCSWCAFSERSLQHQPRYRREHVYHATVVLVVVVVVVVVLVVKVVVTTTMSTITSISLYQHMLKVCDTQFSFPCVLVMASAYISTIMVKNFYEVCRDYNHFWNLTRISDKSVPCINESEVCAACTDDLLKLAC